MALNANNMPKGNGNRKPAPAMDADTYMCRVAQVIDMGIQPQRAWQGQEKPPVQTIMLTYEFTSEFLKDEDGNDMEDKPRWLSEQFAVHHIGSELAKSTKRYKAIDPKMEGKGNFASLVGRPCMVTITKSPGKDGVERNYVAAVGPAPRGVPFPELVNPAKVFDLDSPDMEVFGSLPEWLQDKIKENGRFKGSALDIALNGGNPVKEAKAPAPAPAPAVDEDFDEDIPF